MSKNPLTLIMETNKLNSTNYNNWLRILRIVLDFENQSYVLDKPLPTTSPEEPITFEKCLEDNRKVCSIILALMTNDIQKQYDRLEDVPSIMLRMKEVYAVPDRHIRYARTKAFLGTKMAEGSFVQSYGVKMLSLVEKLEDLKAGLDTDTYIDVLERSRKLSKDEMTLRLGDGKALAVETIGSLNLVISYISKDRIRKLVDLKSLEIDDLDNRPTCESCLKEKMTKKLFVGQSAFANGLLDLIHMDVCGSLNTLARGGFSYFITFTDDHSRYGYVYLMRYKSEAFRRFKEYRLEVENQTGHKIKALQSNRGEEYLGGEFIDYLKENGILFQTPPRTPQLNDMIEMRNQTLLDMVYQISEKTTEYYFYDPSEQKIFVSRNTIFLKKGFPTNSRRDGVLLEESSEPPQQNDATLFEPSVPTDGAPILDIRRSDVGHDSNKWLEAMKSEMDSMDSNQVWTLVDPSKGGKPVKCKWVYKRKLELMAKLQPSRLGSWRKDTLNDSRSTLRKPIHP
ncbi:UNVERIFIED_CONTAM: Retrovirus-related Pol polyprotein from transposon TNT 1-94 [Sesamum calycinum]|uniref:Retrovirus-related Pol polyprotein from transposon TNT 1-94 n=1 Tax=Sesamum calycinum TaxID=2727403 RepID=A0AAW2SUT3_9LAMI